jgi:hypothetical protein
MHSQTPEKPSGPSVWMRIDAAIESTRLHLGSLSYSIIEQFIVINVGGKV